MKCSALLAAGRLGVFKALAEGPRSVSEIADSIGASEFGVARLVEALAGLGYLETADGRYANGPAPRAWYTAAAPVDYTSLLVFVQEVWPFFGGLADAVRQGRPEPTLYQFMEEHPEVGLHFSQYMRANALVLAAPLAERSPIPDTARRLLDLGGSHGLYSIAYCRRNPNLKAVIFDLPEALSETEAIIAAEGLSDRISVQRGDYLKDDIGHGYDVVLCFGMTDGNSYDDNQRLFKTVANALNPGGTIRILSHVKLQAFDPGNALFSLIMFATWGTRTYSFEEVTGWLREARFADFSRTEFPGGISMITAVKSGQ